MQSRSFLRLLAPFAFAALLLACGDDPAGGGGADEPVAKKDAGIKRRDAGSSKATEDEEEEEEEEEETPVKDAGVKKSDAGTAKTSCTTDNDCLSDEMSGIGCCDKPTKVCFFTEEESCPAPVTTKPMQPAYN